MVNSLLCLIFSDWSLEMAIVAGRQERKILSYWEGLQERAGCGTHWPLAIVGLPASTIAFLLFS